MIALPTVRGVLARGGFDADYQAVLNRATALGYTLPSSGQQILQNNIIVGLKTAGVWGKTDIFYVFANNGSQEFATLNWKNPNAFQCSLVNAPVFTSNQGFNSDGATSFINTNWVPSVDAVQMTLNSVHRSFYMVSVGATSALMGIVGSAADRVQLAVSTTNIRLNRNASDLSPSINNLKTLTHIYNRTSASGARLLIDSVFTSHTTASTALATTGRTIFNSSGVIAVSTNRMATFSEGGQLSDAESIALANALNSYMAAI